MVCFQPTGFFQAQVHPDHVTKLATGCSFKVTDVEDTIQQDNNSHQVQQISPEPEDNQEDDYDLSRFDQDTSDELSSEEE